MCALSTEANALTNNCWLGGRCFSQDELLLHRGCWPGPRRRLPITGTRWVQPWVLSSPGNGFVALLHPEPGLQPVWDQLFARGDSPPCSEMGIFSGLLQGSQRQRKPGVPFSPTPNPGCILVGIVHPALLHARQLSLLPLPETQGRKMPSSSQWDVQTTTLPVLPPAQQERDLQSCARSTAEKKQHHQPHLASHPSIPKHSPTAHPSHAALGCRHCWVPQGSAGTQGLSRAVLHLLESTDRTGIGCSCTARR